MRSNAQPPDESLQDSIPAPSPEQERILSHVQSRGVIDKDAAAFAASPTPVKSTQKQQRRRSSPWLLQAEREVDAQVDLHSLTAPEAIAAVEETMERLRILKQRWLRIIHGGNPGRYGPIKSTLDRQLRGPWRARVVRWHTELNNAGSTLVELRLPLG